MKIFLLNMAKLGAARGFYMVYLYTCELYPTDIRTTAVGCSSVCARQEFPEFGIVNLKVVFQLPSDSSLTISRTQLLDRFYVQGDTSGCDKPPVDNITKVMFWPGQDRPGQSELLF